MIYHRWICRPTSALLHRNRNRNQGISRALLKSQGHRDICLFASDATNQMGCPKIRLW